MARSIQQGGAGVLELEYSRLEALHRTYWVRARQGDRESAELVLKIAARRARLLGLDAPTRTQTTHQGTIQHEIRDEIDVSRLSTEQLELLSGILAQALGDDGSQPVVVGDGGTRNEGGSAPLPATNEAIDADFHEMVEDEARE